MKKLTERAARPSRHLFYEEINRNKRIGWLLGLGAVLLVSAIIVTQILHTAVLHQSTINSRRMIP